MLNVTQLRDRVAADYPDATQVSETAVRFVKSANNRPFAVCYLDIGKNLPHTTKDLLRYQDEVIGKHYFEGQKSLQWSNYVYFVTTAQRLESEQFRSIKFLIESDRAYARKFVIAEEDLDTVLAPAPVVGANFRGRSDILSIWTQRLVDARLDGAIFTEADLPKRIAWIEAPRREVAIKRPPSTSRAVPAKPLPFIRSFELTDYRRYPTDRQFQFGKVNLISGPNASGKTSLLEAIELFYCGLHKRGPRKAPQYRLTAELADGTAETASSARRPATYRERNLAWYGVSEVRTNELYQSFAQFNFLDTDAAVSISESTENLDDNLSRLLVGPEASKVWRNIERVHDELEKNLRSLRLLDKQVEEERKELDAAFKAATATKQESEVVTARLNEMLRQLKWEEMKDASLEQQTARLVSSLTGYVPLAEQATMQIWVGSPVTFAALNGFAADTGEVIKNADPMMAGLTSLAADRRRSEELAAKANEARGLANKALKILESRVIERAEERDKARKTISDNSALLERLPFDGSQLTQLSFPVHQNVGSAYQTCAASAAAANERLQASQREYASFAETRDKAVGLGQQLRAIASQILQDNLDPDECPLCHTAFGPDELVRHMAMGVDDRVEQAGKVLLERIASEEARRREAQELESAAAALSIFCDNIKLSQEVSVGEAISRLIGVQQAITTELSRVVVLDREIGNLETQGLSPRELTQTTKRLNELGFSLKKEDLRSAAELIAAIVAAITSLEQQIRTQIEQTDKQEQALQKLLRSPARNTDNLAAELAGLKEHLVSTTKLVEQLGSFIQAFPWPPESPIAELLVSAKSVRAVASELQSIIAREKRDLSVQSDAARRKTQLDEQSVELKARLARLGDARKTLSALIAEHSLTSAMAAALKENRSAIESIFLRIHAPAEFSGIGSTLNTLVRKVDSSEANMAEISTGQRAAVALSIFLAQNGQLSSAPPIILIDDPIAHVDDLNSLSFLDYLREVAIDGKRQIFFATANDKMTTLFERKFDFLGEDFRRISLSRER